LGIIIYDYWCFAQNLTGCSRLKWGGHVKVFNESMDYKMMTNYITIYNKPYKKFIRILFFITIIIFIITAFMDLFYHNEFVGNFFIDNIFIIFFFINLLAVFIAFECPKCKKLANSKRLFETIPMYAFGFTLDNGKCRNCGCVLKEKKE
jgi:hypothetical protein